MVGPYAALVPECAQYDKDEGGLKSAVLSQQGREEVDAGEGAQRGVWFRLQRGQLHKALRAEHARHST
eukprot:1755716-Rhodomonas_salina.1